jgi:hypothetical protein
LKRSFWHLISLNEKRRKKFPAGGQVRICRPDVRKDETALADIKTQHAKEKQALTERQKKDEDSVRSRIRK